MKEKLVLAARLLLGLVFTVFGLNGFFEFLPAQEPTGDAATFMGGLAASGYFFIFLKATETLCGLALLANRYVPLALTILAPVVLNIILYHAFLDPAGIVLPIILAALGIYLAYSYRQNFASVLVQKAEPS